MLETAQGQQRRHIAAVIFTDLWASELLGLTWGYVEFAASESYVRQRADRYNDIGSPKSVSWLRAVPMTPIGANLLNGWKLECPNGELNLVFSNGKKSVENLSGIYRRGLGLVQLGAGVMDAPEEGRQTLSRPIPISLVIPDAPISPCQSQIFRPKFSV